MNRNEVVETIKNEIWMNGFQPEIDERFSPLPFLKNEGDLYVAVSIRERLDFPNCDFDKRIAAYKVEVQVSVRKMGGHPDTEELFEAAEVVNIG